ncbi:MAG: alpha/beta hydrolase [Candidatus Paceibacteria bacterium]
MKTVKMFGALPIAVTSVVPRGKAKAHLVFVHMSWGGAWAFRFYLPFLAQRGYACHALDLRGHGKSGGTVEGATMQDYVDDVRTAVTGLDINRPVIIGHSMGGLVGLMYGAQHPTAGIAALDASPAAEVQGSGEEKTYPSAYRPTDAGMPKNPLRAMAALPDIPPMRMFMMKLMLGVESGVARSERKRGISVPKESLAGTSILCVGAENGTSLPFGIGIEKMRQQAAYYGTDAIEIKGATHPGLLIGVHWRKTAEAILEWLPTLG